MDKRIEITINAPCPVLGRLTEIVAAHNSGRIPFTYSDIIGAVKYYMVEYPTLGGSVKLSMDKDKDFEYLSIDSGDIKNAIQIKII